MYHFLPTMKIAPRPRVGMVYGEDRREHAGNRRRNHFDQRNCIGPSSSKLKPVPDWQLSIGAEVVEAEVVSRGDSYYQRSGTHRTPLFTSKRPSCVKSRVVAVGADATTRMQVAASFNLFDSSSRSEQESSFVSKNGAVALIQKTEKNPL